MIDSVIFGLGYKARSGKDTAVAEIIKQRGLLSPMATYDPLVHGERYDIRKYSFADALRREVETEARRAGGIQNLFKSNYCFVRRPGCFVNLPEWVTYDPNGEVNEQYPLGKQRTLCQWWGTEFRRELDDNYWVKRLAEQIELEKPQIALITDMRFPNEFDFVSEYGETILVQRDGLPESTHASETALAGHSPEDWSIILENNGTLSEFLEGAVTCFDELLNNYPQFKK